MNDEICKNKSEDYFTYLKVTNRLLPVTAKVAQHAFDVLAVIAQPNSNYTISDAVCFATNYYKQFIDAYTDPKFQKLAEAAAHRMYESWVPYLKEALKLNIDDNSCKSLNITPNPLLKRRVSKAMALFDALEKYLK